MSATAVPSELYVAGDGRPLRGEIRPPSDKSITLRALLVAALADGESHLDDILACADSDAMLGALRRLGVSIVGRGEQTVVRGGALRRSNVDAVTIDVAESGTAARLLLGALPASQRDVEMIARGSLRTRPMRRVVVPLREMGARIEAMGQDDDHLPLRICAGAELRGIDHRLAVPSAQVKSALLFAGCGVAGETVVREPIPTRDHTERMFRALGARLVVRDLAAEREVRLQGPFVPPPLALRIPADASAVLYLGVLALAIPHSRLVARDVLANPTRSGALAVLRRMGARIFVHLDDERGGEPTGALTFESSELQGVEVEADEIPSLIDDVPVLAVAAALARAGVTRFRGVAELRVKESDRIASTVAFLRAFGCDAVAEGDDLVVPGGCGLHAASIDSKNDHRIALASLVLAKSLPARSHLRGFEAVTKSYPGILRDLAAVGSAS